MYEALKLYHNRAKEGNENVSVTNETVIHNWKVLGSEGECGFPPDEVECGFSREKAKLQVYDELKFSPFGTRVPEFARRIFA